jgi:hypothetical protein
MFSNLTTFRFRVSWFLLTYLAMVAQVALSHNDKNHCRDAKDDSYTEGLIVNWEIIWRSGRKERYQRQTRAVECSMNQNYMNHAVNWEAISAIGQLVGAIAVVVSLMYLAREIRSNARSARMRFCGQPESVPRTTRNAPAFS